MTGFPGGTAVSRIRAYNWPAADGRRGGSPHLHTASTEGYLVLAGEGRLESLSGQGHQEHDLTPDTVVWFTPGTVHRLVNISGDLDVLVVMQNGGLPEAGDAVLTFPAEYLCDPGRYASAAAVPSAAEAGEKERATAARARRDLAIDGYLELREQVRAHGPEALAGLRRAAAALVAERVARWRDLWEQGPLEQAVQTGQHLDMLAAGVSSHLADAAVTSGDAQAESYGMCGLLRTWDLTKPVP